MSRAWRGCAAALAAVACFAAGSGASSAYAQAKAAAPQAKGAPAPAQSSGVSETGVASWYGPDFHGKPTSNGEIYDKEKLSAAHRTLPFGTYVLVHNLDNGSSVVVRVNDRGPFAKDRIIDLSEAAARIVGMIATGTARVSLTIIPKEEALAWKGGPLEGSSTGGAAGEGDGAASGGASPIASLPADARVRSGRGQHVLYVDDDEVMTVMVAGLLERLGYRFSVASSARSAIDMLTPSDSDVDLVVTDFSMPQMSGIDLARALLGLRPGLPVAITSGYISDELRASAAELGVVGVMRKERTLEDLAALVHDALAGSQSRS